MLHPNRMTPQTPPQQQEPAPLTPEEQVLWMEAHKTDAAPSEANSSMPGTPDLMRVPDAVPVTLEQVHELLQAALLQVEGIQKAHQGDDYRAPAPTVPKDGSAVLRFRYELHDSAGWQFGHEMDIPLPGFQRVGMLPVALRTVQAALTTFVMQPLCGEVTEYIESCRAGTAYSEVPLRFAPLQQDRSSEEDNSGGRTNLEN